MADGSMWRTPRIVRAWIAFGTSLGLVGLSHVALWLARSEAKAREKPQAEGMQILFGIRAIARFLGVTRKQAHVLVRGRQIPSFDLAGVICARRSELRAHIEKLEHRAE